MTVNARPAPSAAWRGASLWLARLAWAATTLIVLGLLAASQPNLVTEINSLEAQYARFGFTRAVALVYFLTLNAIPTLSFTAAAGVIFWRRSTDRFIFLVSLMLITFSLPLTPSITTLSSSWANWLITPLTALGQVAFLAFLFLFPDGRFVPSWSRWLILGLVGVDLLVSVAPLPDLAGRWQGGLVVGVFLVASTAGALAQIYRYHHVSSPVERQQTKWVLAGVLGAIVGLLICLAALVAGGDSFALATAIFAIAVGCLLLIPASFAFSILRYRLWDIDLIVRRTLIYSALSALLALLYFSSVVVLQSGFEAATGQGDNPLVAVVSTLAIAALFFPLRNGVQAFIDRRFYRQKYDAARVLSAFSAAARDETDLDKLTARLAEVVQETMQPVNVGLWLRPAAPPIGGSAAGVPFGEVRRAPAPPEAGPAP